MPTRPPPGDQPARQLVHELRSLLNSMVLQLHLIERQADGLPEVQEMASKALRAGEALAGKLDGLAPSQGSGERKG